MKYGSFIVKAPECCPKAASKYSLTMFLAAYAEIGQEYVDKLELILESNNLKEFDRFQY